MNPTDDLGSVALLAQSARALWLVNHLIPMVFVFCFGACVGSFVNVLNYRLPAGMSVISPPSRCTTCGAQLRFFRENLPILGWFLVRGRCRYCGVKVSSQYMIVELLMALLFLGLYAALYTVNASSGYFADVSCSFWYRGDFARTWLAYFALAFLLAGLISMTIIDARTFTIPIQIPVAITIFAFLAYGVQFAIYPDGRTSYWPVPGVGWAGSLIAVGGMVGTCIALVLLRSGKLRPSFADYYEHVSEEDVIGDYPHARREMVVELAYLMPIAIGMVIGAVAARWMPGSHPPHWIQAIAASFAGYLMGAGVIWAIRILGTLAFGREAMGLGDVHLLGAVGAVMGWFDPLAVFFIAPFFGVTWALLGAIFRKLRRELPYGPHLALATFVVLFCRPGLMTIWGWIVAGGSLPPRQLLP